MDGGQGTDSDNFDGGADLDRVVYGSLDRAGHVQLHVCLHGAAGRRDDGQHGRTIELRNGRRDIENVQSSVESVTGSTTAADTITGSCGANTFAGERWHRRAATTDGSDTFNGDPAACAPNGGDFLGGGEGNDVVQLRRHGCAAGFDTVTYGTPYTGAAAISVTLDDAANDNDGLGNVTDNVHGDCERIIGTANGDTINAAAADQARAAVRPPRRRHAHGQRLRRPAERRGRHRHGQLRQRRHRHGRRIETNNGCEL